MKFKSTKAYRKNNQFTTVSPIIVDLLYPYWNIIIDTNSLNKKRHDFLWFRYKWTNLKTFMDIQFAL